MEFERDRKQKRRKLSFPPFLLVGLPGFEPGQTEPKPVVLPLHHSPIISAFLEKRCKDRGFIIFLQIKRTFFFVFRLFSCLNGLLMYLNLIYMQITNKKATLLRIYFFYTFAKE